MRLRLSLYYKELNSEKDITDNEGYVENLVSPQYFYYRRDHLSDDREVWLAVGISSRR